MFPTLFDSRWIGIDGDLAFTIPTYFAAIILGFLGGSYLAYRDAMKIGIDKQAFIDFAIWMLIAGVLGSRFAHVLMDGFFMDYVHLCVDPFLTEGKTLSGGKTCVSNLQCLAAQNRGLDMGAICNAKDGLCYPQRDCFRALKFWSGGLTIYGGLIASVTVSWFYLKKHNMPWLKMADFAGYAIPFGLAMGRLGCFGAGCCFGDTCDSEILGVHFPAGSGAYQAHYKHHYPELAEQWRMGLKTSLAVWPTQLISAAYNFLIFAFAYFWMRKKKYFDGQVFLTMLVLYAVARFSVEFIRADPRGGVLGLATSQWVAIITVLVAVFFLFRARKNNV